MWKIVFKKSWIVVLFILLINHTSLFSQKFDLKNLIALPEHITLAIKSINIPSSFKRFDKPKKHKGIYAECFKENTYLPYCLGCIAPIAYSSDEEFAVLMYGPVHRTVQDSIDFMKTRPIIDTICMMMRMERPAKVAASPKTFHRVLMNVHINQLLQRNKAHEVTSEEFDKYVTFYPEKYARTKFNADSAATYYYWPALETKPYREKYIGSKALMLHKINKGHVILFCFYTKKSEDRIDDFMKEIEGIVWFND